MVVYNDKWILISGSTHMLQRSNTYTVQDLKAAGCHKISKPEEGILLSNLLWCTCESYVPCIYLISPLNGFCQGTTEQALSLDCGSGCSTQNKEEMVHKTTITQNSPHGAATRAASTILCICVQLPS